MRHSHFLLHFLVGLVAILCLGPLISYVWIEDRALLSSIADLYVNAYYVLIQAGFAGAIALIALSFFAGLIIDSLNVLLGLRRPVGVFKRFVAALWRQTKKVDYIESVSDKRISSHDDRDPLEYPRLLVWLREHPSYGEARSWEFFQAHAFKMMNLIFMTMFWILVTETAVIELITQEGITITDILIVFSPLVLYIVSVPGEIFHLYARARTELAFREAYQREQDQNTNKRT